MKVLGLIFLFSFIVLIDLTRLIKAAERKTLIIYGVILSLGFMLSLLIVTNNTPPNLLFLTQKLVPQFFPFSD